MAATMLRRDAWRAMNVIYGKRVATGQWPMAWTLMQLGSDLDPDALVWLDDLGWLAAENQQSGGKVGMHSTVRAPVPAGGIRPGDRHDPTIVSIGCTPAGVHWVENDPYNTALRAVRKARGGRLGLASWRVDVDVAAALVDAGLVCVIDVATGAPAPQQGQAARWAGRRDGAGYQVRTTDAGRRVLGDT